MGGLGLGGAGAGSQADMMQQMLQSPMTQVGLRAAGGGRGQAAKRRELQRRIACTPCLVGPPQPCLSTSLPFTPLPAPAPCPQALLRNPELLRTMMQANPAVRQMMESNPEVGPRSMLRLSRNRTRRARRD